MTNEEMFNKNIKIAYKVANKYRDNYINEIEDIKQTALLGLWKAVSTYNGKYAFSTYAFKVVQNEVNMYFRKRRKEVQKVSLSKEIGDNITIEDVLENPVNYIEEIENEIEYERIIKIRRDVLYNVKDSHKKAYELLQQGKTQQEVSNLVRTIANIYF